MRWLIASVSALLVFAGAMLVFVLLGGALGEAVPPPVFIITAGLPMSGLVAAQTFFATAKHFRGPPN